MSCYRVDRPAGNLQQLVFRPALRLLGFLKVLFQLLSLFGSEEWTDRYSYYIIFRPSVGRRITSAEYKTILRNLNTGIPQNWKYRVITREINVSPQKTITSDSVIQLSSLPAEKNGIYIHAITILLISQRFLVDVGELYASRAWVDGVIYMLSATG